MFLSGHLNCTLCPRGRSQPTSTRQSFAYQLKVPNQKNHAKPGLHSVAPKCLSLLQRADPCGASAVHSPPRRMALAEEAAELMCS